MEPHFPPNDKQMFYKYLDSAHVYFEYGAGGSTVQASLRDSIQTIYSVESDKQWHDAVRQKIKKNNVVYLFNEMRTKPNTWGHPGKDSTTEQQINYSNQLGNLTTEQQQSIDLILIDGRFRVACCLKAFSLIRPDCIVAFDDFFPRIQYSIVLQYFTIVEKTTDECMVLLRKKPNVSVPEAVLRFYEVQKD